MTMLARTVLPFFTLSGAMDPVSFTSSDDCGGNGVEKNVAGISNTAIRKTVLNKSECLIISGSD
jgi:hypothetical protein